MRKINKRGFTLIEIVAVIVIFGVIMTTAIIAVTKYVDWARENTYNSYVHNIEIASKNNMVDCVSGKSECDIPESGYSKRLALDDLIEAGYSEKLRDPDKDGAFCSGYVLIENEGASVPDLKYKGCLKCSNYETAGCDFIKDDEDNKPSDCDSIVGQSTEWTRNSRIIKYGCDSNGNNCKYRKTFSGTPDESLIMQKEMETVNGQTCPVNIYIDTTKPECELNMTGEIGQNNWYLEDVKVTLTPKIKTSREGAKVVDFGISTSTKKEYNGVGELTVTTGITTVFGYVKDDLGNENHCVQEIKVDASKPEQSLMLGYQVYPEAKNKIETNDNVLQINALEKYKSVKGILVFLNEKVTGNITIDYASTTATTNTSGDSEAANISSGSMLVHANNQNVVEFIFPVARTNGFIDITGIDPEKISKVVMLVGNPNGLYTNKNMLVYNFASDSGTGISGYSFDGGSTWQDEKYKWYSSNTTVKAKVKDTLGNDSDEQSINIQYIDKILPTVKIDTYEYLSNKTRGEKLRTDTNTNVSITSWKKHNYIFDLSGSTDDESGIDYVEWGWNPGHNNTLSTTLTKDNTTREIDYNDYSLETDGARYAKFTVYDKAGNSSEISATVYIDKVAPSAGTLTFKKNNSSGSVISNGSVVNTDVYVTKNNGSDTMSGHSSTKYTLKINGVVVDSNVTVNKMYSQEGEYELIVTTTDKAGHTSTRTYNFAIDKTAPTINIDTYEYSNSSRVKKLRTDANVNVSITSWKSYGYAFDLSNSLDDYSGIDYVNWQWNYTNKSTLDKTIKDSADRSIDHEYTLTGNGVRYGVFTVYDKAGNFKSINVTVYIDNAAPTAGTLTFKKNNNSGSVINNGAVVNTDVYVSKNNGSDVLSGHSSTKYTVKLDGNVIDSDVTENKTYSQEGEYELTLTTTDRAGRTSTRTYNFAIDKTAPTIKIDTYEYLNKTKGAKIRTDTDKNVKITQWAKYNYIFDLSGSMDDYSGIDYVVWGWNSGNNQELSTTLVKEDIDRAIDYNDYSLETDGARYAKFTVYDKAGNSKTISATVYIDKTAPTIKINAYKHSSSSPYYTGDVLASVTDGDISITSWKNYGYYFDISGSLDSLSGIASIKWQWNDYGKTELSKTLPSANVDEILDVLYGTLTGNGARYGKFTITDNAGNTNEATVTVYVDKTKPTIKIKMYDYNSAKGNLLGTYTNQNIEKEWRIGGYYFDISESSDNVEIESIKFDYNKSGNLSENTDLLYTSDKTLTSTTTLTGWGYRYAKFTFVDKAGNSRSVSIIVRISKDDLITLKKPDGTTGGTDKLYQRYGLGYYDLNLNLLNKIDIPELTGCAFVGYYDRENVATGNMVIDKNGYFMNSLYNVTSKTWYASWEQTAKLGDVNNDGKVSIQDVTLINKFLDDEAKLTICQLVAADVNGDNFIESYVLDTGNVIDACPNNRAYVCTYDDCMIQHYLSKGLAAMECE